MIKLLKQLSLFTLLSSVSMFAYSAGFDCSKATTWVEKSICRNSELSKLDEQMTAIYRQQLANDKDSATHLKNQQREWLSYHRNTCKTVACLKREYQEYIENANDGKLTINNAGMDAINTASPKTNQFGKFQDKIKISVYQGETEGWQESTVTNTLRLDKIDNKSKLALLNIDFIFTNAHTCTLEDKVVHWSENHWQWQDYSLDPECELRIYPYKNKLLLQDLNNQCRETMCGARGYFNGIILHKK